MQDLSHDIKTLREHLELGLRHLDLIESRMRFQKESLKDQWITTQEAANMSGINASTLSRYALTGQVICKRVGGRWKFPRSKVEDLSFLKDGEDAK